MADAFGSSFGPPRPRTSTDPERGASRALATLAAAATGPAWAVLAFVLMSELAGLSAESEMDALMAMVLFPVVFLLVVLLPIVGAVCCWQRSRSRPALVGLLHSQILLAGLAVLAAVPASALVPG